MGLGDQSHASAASAPGRSLGGWVSPRTHLDECEEENFSCPHQGSNCEPSSPEQIAISTALSWLACESKRIKPAQDIS